MEDSFYIIPQYLDEPERFFIFTTEEALALITPMSLGIMLGFFVIGMVLGLFALLAYKRFVGQEGKGLLLAAKYWYFPHQMSAMSFATPSYKRFFQG